MPTLDQGKPVAQAPSKLTCPAVLLLNRKPTTAVQKFGFLIRSPIIVTQSLAVVQKPVLHMPRPQYEDMFIQNFSGRMCFQVQSCTFQFFKSETCILKRDMLVQLFLFVIKCSIFYNFYCTMQLTVAKSIVNFFDIQIYFFCFTYEEIEALSLQISWETDLICLLFTVASILQPIPYVHVYSKDIYTIKNSSFISLS